jgi:hypothetical protein
MFNLRTRRHGTVTSRLLVVLALFALAGTACSDLEGALPIDVPEAGDETPADEAADEAPAEDGAGDDAVDEGEDAAGDDAEAPADDAADGGDDAAGDDAAGDDAVDEAPVDDGSAEDAGVEPITADDVREVCADQEASAVTADELAPLVNMTPETFEALACAAL